MTNDNIDFDSLLDLESQYYQTSYQDALIKGSQHTLHDGKVFGIQTGFQRFVIIGALKRANQILLQVIQNKLKNDTNNANTKLEKSLKSIDQIQQLLNSFYTENESDSKAAIKSSNSAIDVNLYEKNIKVIRSKLKIIYLQLGYKDLYSNIEKSCNLVTGELKSTQLLNDDQDIW